MGELGVKIFMATVLSTPQECEGRVLVRKYAFHRIHDVKKSHRFSQAFLADFVAILQDSPR